MRCEYFLERLDAWLDDRMARDERGNIEAHLENCPVCREIAERFSGPGALAPVVPEDLAAAVLHRTSGSPCASARERLCDRVDGGLGDEDVALLDGHLQRCPECTEVALVLARMRVDLPRLAELDPGPGFVDRVMAAVRPAAASAPASRWSRWAEVLGGLLARPRFALEGAYVGMALMFLVFSVPGTPLQAVPRNVLNLIVPGPDGVVDPGPEAAERRSQEWKRVRDEVTSEARALMRATQQHLRKTGKHVAAGVDGASHAASAQIQDWGTLLQHIASNPENEANRPADKQDREQGDE